MYLSFIPGESGFTLLRKAEETPPMRAGMNEGILRCLGVAVPSDSMYEMAQFYESIDLKVKTVTGYPGSTDIFAAIDRSEVNGDVMSLATVRG